MGEVLPSVFIGSSMEGIDIAREVELQLQRDAVTTIWKDGVFGLGRGTLESLMKVLDQFDFAVMVLSPDDLLESRSQSYASPRDNVLFEMGLFMGKLGRSRVFIVHEQDANLKLPSDLAGVAISPYRKRENLSAALSPTCTPIIKAIRSLGFCEQRTQQHIRRLQDRQETTESRIKEAENKVDRIFAYTMPDSTFLTLKRLSAGKFGAFKITKTLRRELRHLRNLGYITVSGSISRLPKQGDNLSEFITTMDVARQFVQFREKFEEEERGD
jgi:hypothetical protein